MARSIILPILLVLASCKREEPAPAKAPPSAVPSTPAPAPTAAVAAAPVPTPDAAEPGLAPQELAYLDLLWVDLVAWELIRKFPGAPAGTTFDSSRYAWQGPGIMSHEVPGELPGHLAAAVAAVAAAPASPEHDAIRAHVEALDRWLPRLLSLRTYYADDRFVDDEFERGRREEPDVLTAAGELAATRAAMRAAVLARWAEQAAPDGSPRGIVDRAVIACAAAGAVLVPPPPRDPAALVSGCRRALAQVVALPADVRGDLDARLRAVASVVGDHVASGSTLNYELPEQQRLLVRAYVAQRAQLPTTPTERP